MNRYSIIITLAGGDRVEAKSVGTTQDDALSRLMATEQFQTFVAGREITNTEIAFLETVETVSPDNYVLQESTTREGWYVVTDKVNNVVIQFAKGRYNETAHITPLFDFPKEPVGTATILREIGEFLATYHEDIIKSED